jgi:hypothetical protein
MPWKHNGKIIREGKAWVSDRGVKHPGVWMRWTDSDKAEHGLVWEEPPALQEPYDDRFYHGRNVDGSLIEISLTDVNEVDSDGNAITDPSTGQQMITKGLKTVWIEKTKETTNLLLSKSDWLVTRKTEKGTAIPNTVQTYRDAVRTSCNTIETKINNCSNLKQFIALFDVPVDSDGTPTGNNPPIKDFPNEN